MEEIDSALIATVLGATLLLIFFSGVVITAVVLYRKRRLLHKAELETQETAYQTELLRLENEVQDATLSNVARELHDNIGHRVALAKLHLNRIVGSDGLPEQRTAQVANLDAELTSLLSSVRGLSRGLSAEGLANDSLHDMLAREVERLERTDKYSIHASLYLGVGVTFDLRLKLVVLRILQEGISNIIHHAKADTIWIELRETRLAYVMCLRDNGRGISGAQSSGMGVKSMQARAASVGGQLELNDHAEGGAQLTFTFGA
jgi:signal transduction histidine kinase